jgi:hypothetical protein
MKYVIAAIVALSLGGCMHTIAYDQTTSQAHWVAKPVE